MLAKLTAVCKDMDGPPAPYLREPFALHEFLHTIP